MYLLDTNVIIYLLNNKLTTSAKAFLTNVIDESPNISVITRMECLGYNFLSPEEEILTRVFVSNSTVYFIDEAIASIAVDIRKTRKIRLPDAIIGATAIVNNLRLITANTADFKNIERLQLVDLNEL